MNSNLELFSLNFLIKLKILLNFDNFSTFASLKQNIIIFQLLERIKL